MMEEAVKSDLLDISGEIRFQTDRAILFFDGAVEVWLPLSQIEAVRKGASHATVTMPEWLAVEKGLV